MSWNYRIVKDEQGYFITDVYYKDDEPHSWGERHNILDSETYENLTFQIDAVMKAYGEPVLYAVGETISTIPSPQPRGETE